MFAEGDLIAAQGEPGETTYVIVEGDVDAIADGRTLAVRGSGDIIGEMSVISSRPRSHRSVRGQMSAFSRSASRLSKRSAERPDTALALMRVLCERLTSDDLATS